MLSGHVAHLGCHFVRGLLGIIRVDTDHGCAHRGTHSGRDDHGRARSSEPDGDHDEATSLTGIGKKYTERGITAVVTAATLTRSIHLNGATKTAGRGAAFAVIATKITNHAKTGLDLTCSYDVANKLINAEDQEYGSIDELYNYPGNPACNAALEPGFREKMIWVYRVPTGTHIVGWGFSDDTSLDYASDPLTLVPLDLK